MFKNKLDNIMRLIDNLNDNAKSNNTDIDNDKSDYELSI